MEKIYWTFGGHTAETDYQGTRTVYKFLDTTPKGERIEVHITVCTDDGTKHSLPRLWYKAGYTPALLKEYLWAEVFVTDNKGCWSKYNPQIIEGTTKINFEWVEKANTANRIALMTEIVKRAYSA